MRREGIITLRKSLVKITKAKLGSLSSHVLIDVRQPEVNFFLFLNALTLPTLYS